MSTRVDALHSDFVATLDGNERPAYIYTYPFKGAYRPLTESALVTESWALATGRLNVYVHIPYCEMKCSFCNLFTTNQHTGATLRQYCQTLLREIRLAASLVNRERCQIDSLYFGGGTPSLLLTELLSQIICELRRLFAFRPDAELAIETAPNSTDLTRLHDLVKIGFRRLSVGIQSFDPRDLHAMKRIYESQLGRRTALAALDAGFANVNVDLIYGLPQQTPEAWLLNLRTAVALGIQTITVYPLTLRTRTRFGRLHAQAPDSFPRAPELYHLYDIAVDFLSSHGYRQYTFSGFAKDAGGNRHETNEFAGIPTLGLGVAALSYSPSLHYTSGDYLANDTARIMADYKRAIDAASLPIRTGILLDDDEARRRYVILRLLHDGLDRQRYQAQFRESVEVRFDAEIEVLRREQCLEEVRNRLALSRRGRRFSSVIAGLFASWRVKHLAASYQ